MRTKLPTADDVRGILEGYEAPAVPTLHRQDNGARLAVLPSGHVIEELLNGGSIVHILLYGSVPCRETFAEALALFEGTTPCAHK